MELDAAQYGLGALSGALVGFSLGMFGGGGSILAVPLMIYLVGVPHPHIAIGTSALAVAANAASGLAEHARHGVVKWRSAGLFSIAGILGAIAGSALGKAVNGQRLLLLFAILMVVVATMMVLSRDDEGKPDADCTLERTPKVIGYGAATGAFSGFFGIGGGFLIVPGLIASTGMPMINAVGSSLVAVFAFGLTTAVSYAISGFVIWPLAAAFIVGGIAGGQVGCFSARRLSSRKGKLKLAFAALIVIGALYMAAKSTGLL